VFKPWPTRSEREDALPVAGRAQYQDYPLGPLRQPLPRVTRRNQLLLFPSDYVT